MHNIIAFSVKNKLIIWVFVLFWVVWGIYSLMRLPLDAIPDITNKQVVVATQSPNLSAVEIEQYLTYPIEMAMANLQGKTNIRSVSQFGISIVTIEFEDNVDIVRARSMVSERLTEVKEEIPPGFGSPMMLPVTTGLGEIFQYTIKRKDASAPAYSPMELREIQDWVVKRQLLGIKGIAEVSSFGGYERQYQVVVNPTSLKNTNITLGEVYAAIENGSNNTGAAYIEKNKQNYFIRGIGMAETVADLENIFIKNNEGQIVAVKDVAEVREDGAAVRYGALTQDKGEAVGGIVLMLKGENSRAVIDRIKAQLPQIEKSLPKGLKVEAFLDRELLINRTIQTVSKNLMEGGLIVIFVLVLLLGNLRAGWIVATVIPLSMLFAISMMVLFGVSGNLMSLGAIDFGLIVDGAVIIVENAVHHLYKKNLPVFASKSEQKSQQSETVIHAATQMVSSSFFGQIIILIVYVPLLTLSGIEGKMFQPMALTVIFALLGAMILSLTYVPMMCDTMLRFKVVSRMNFSDKLMAGVQRLYTPILKLAMRLRIWVVTAVLAVAVFLFSLFSGLGSEFIPQLDEGDYAVEVRMLPGTSLTQMIEMGEYIAGELQKKFPDEIQLVTGKIGTGEVPMDPMSIEEMDMMLTMHDKSQWKKAHTRQEFEALLDEALHQVPGIYTSIQQPIAMRFNELMTGAKTDVIVKILGNDLEKLAQIGKKIQTQIQKIEGATDVSISKAEGLQQLFVTYKRENLLRYGMHIADVSRTLQMAIAGTKAGIMFEGNRRYDLMVKLQMDSLDRIRDIGNILVTNDDGLQIPLSELADIEVKEGAMAVFREQGERNLNVNLNVRGRDIQTVVNEVQKAVEQNVKLPAGYRVEYGGQFENLTNAKQRLSIVLPFALLLIIFLLYITFGSIKDTLLVFSAIPLAAMGGIAALWLRQMPFSISAGVGFIALFGVAVLNGIVLIASLNDLKNRFPRMSVRKRVILGVQSRLRPVLMTAAVASLGFLPMALAAGAGAEVQKPLATVVIGGLVTATLLTLFVLPVVYAWIYGGRGVARQKKK